MEIAVDQSDPGAGVVLQIIGTVTLRNVSKLRETLAMYIGSGHDLIIDLTAITFMDTTGITVMSRAERQVRERGHRMEIVIDQGRVIDQPRFNDVTRAFRVHPSVAQARTQLTDPS